jgi:hypothetical protein
VAHTLTSSILTPHIINPPVLAVHYPTPFSEQQKKHHFISALPFLHIWRIAREKGDLCQFMTCLHRRISILSVNRRIEVLK